MSSAPAGLTATSQPSAPSHPRCGAKTRRRQGTCGNTAGLRTNHVGQGRCWLHGGASPIKHGRYSTIQRERIRDLILKHEEDKDPLNILPEVAALRAMFQDYIERYDAHTDALIAWHQSYEATRVPLSEEKVMAFEAVVDEWEIRLKETTEPTPKQLADIASARAFVDLLRGNGPLGANKPRQVLDISDAYRILAEIGKMVERVEKIRAANAISRPDLNRIMQEMWRSVDARVTDEVVKNAVKEDWLRVALA
jgi:hypothetical protein